MRSILLTKQMRGTRYLSAWRQTVSDCGCTPATESNTHTAPSRTRSERSTSTVKSTWKWSARRSEEHTSELQSRQYLVCRLLLETKKLVAASPHARRGGLPAPRPHPHQPSSRSFQCYRHGWAVGLGQHTGLALPVFFFF